MFYDFISGRKRGTRSAQRYGQLVVAYRAVLLPTTEWLWSGAERGPVADLLAAAAEAANNVDVITFNHDIVVENVLADLDEAQGRWCLRHGYGHFATGRHFTKKKDADEFDDTETCKHRQPIRVFKLHGSLNWYVDSNSPVPDASVLRGERGADQRILITLRRKVPRNLHRSGRFSWPVLIPPVYAKQPFIRNFMARYGRTLVVQSPHAIGSCSTATRCPRSTSRRRRNSNGRSHKTRSWPTSMSSIRRPHQRPGMPNPSPADQSAGMQILVSILAARPFA